MKLLSYNIQDGGEGREDALVAVCRAANPDVVVLQEADASAVVEALAEALGLGIARMVVGKNKRTLAALSRDVPDWTQEIDLDHGGIALRVQFKKPAWAVVTTHLWPHASPADDTKRQDQVQRLVRSLAYMDLPAVLTGDMNAHPPGEAYIAENLTANDKERLAGGEIPAGTLPLLYAAGWQDAVTANWSNHVDAWPPQDDAPPLPDRNHPPMTFPLPTPAVRYDHALTNAKARDVGLVTDARVFWHEQATSASDHLPVLVEIAEDIGG